MTTPLQGNSKSLESGTARALTWPAATVPGSHLFYAILTNITGTVPTIDDTALLATGWLLEEEHILASTLWLRVYADYDAGQRAAGFSESVTLAGSSPNTVHMLVEIAAGDIYPVPTTRLEIKGETDSGGGTSTTLHSGSVSTTTSGDVLLGFIGNKNNTTDVAPGPAGAFYPNFGTALNPRPAATAGAGKATLGVVVLDTAAAGSYDLTRTLGTAREYVGITLAFKRATGDVFQSAPSKAIIGVGQDRSRRPTLGLVPGVDHGAIDRVFFRWRWPKALSPDEAPPPIPIPTTLPAADFSADGTSVRLLGSIDPRGQTGVTWQFEYGTTPALGSFAPVPPGIVPVITNTLGVDTILTGLSPASSYAFRLVAILGGQSFPGDKLSFTTTDPVDRAAPEVAASTVTSIGSATATLNATIDANNSATSYKFEYGTTTSYGSTTTQRSIGAGSDPVGVSEPISGLAPGATYHWRLVATNGIGTAATTDQTFLTDSGIVTAAPAVVASDVDTVNDLAATTVRLRGTVDPNNLPTTYHFLYQPHAGGTVFFTTETSAGTNDVPTPVDSGLITGLTGGTQYDFTLVAQNFAGSTQSSTLSFTTPPLLVTAAPAITMAAPVSSELHDVDVILRGTVDPNNLATTYYFEIGTNTSYTLGHKPSGGASAGSNDNPVAVDSGTITGLTGGTLYHWRLVATNSISTTTGSDQTFTTPATIVTAAPAVTSAAVSALTDTQVQLNATVDPNNLATTYHFEYGTSASYGLRMPTSGEFNNAGSGDAAVTVDSGSIGSLAASTLYHWRIVAQNTAGTTNGTDQTFTTGAARSLASIGSEVAAPASATSELVQASITPNNADTTYHLEYGTSTSYGSRLPASDAAIGNGATGVGVSQTIPSLSPFQVYHYRFIAQNSVGTTTGTDHTFTSPGAPTVIASAVLSTELTSTTATLRGTVNPRRADVTAQSFDYSTDSTFATGVTNVAAVPAAGSGSSAVSVSAAISGLSGSTTYYFRLKATNGVGTATVGSGGTPSFATPAAVVTAAPGLVIDDVLTGELTNVAVTLRGSIDPNNSNVTTQTFLYGTDPALAGASTVTASPGAGALDAPVAVTSGSITGLTANTVYYYQLHAVNGIGTTDSAIKSFNTKAPPEVTAVNNVDVADLTNTTATLRGTVDPNGDAASWVVEWGASTGSYALGSATGTTTAGFAPENVTSGSSVTGLAADTTYFWRVRATNTYGTNVASPERTFRTKAAPAVTTSIPSVTGGDLADTTVTLRGTVDSNLADTLYHFEYGTSGSLPLGASTSDTTNGAGGSAQNVSSGSLTSLTPNTDYFFRLVATNTYATTASTIKTFHTAAVPEVTTKAVVAADLTDTTVILRGTVDANKGTTTYQFKYGTDTTYGSLSPVPAGDGGTAANPINIASPTITGLPTGTTFHYTLTATNQFGTSIDAADRTFQTTGPAPGTAAPDVVPGAVSGLTDTIVTLNGTVDPNNLTTTYHFEYGTTSAYGSATSTISLPAGADAVPVDTGTQITSLAAATLYHWRLVATNSINTSNTTDQTFTTGALRAVPTVTVDAASAITHNAATISGTVNPQNADTTYQFQYGTSTSYGSSLPASATSIGNGGSAVVVTANLTGLSTNTGYHWRIQAINEKGTTNSADQTFTTAGVPTVTVTAVDSSELTSTVVTLRGTIDPNRANVTVQEFDYAKDAAFTVGLVTLTAAPTVGAGDSAVDVSKTSTAALTADTDYWFRLRATNSAGSTTSSSSTFHTPAVVTTAKPTVTNDTPAGANLADTSVVFSGKVNPQNLATTYFWQYGPNTSYGTNIPSSPASAGSGGADVTETSTTVTGLTANTTYHCRLTATNSKGTTNSADTVFQTEGVPTVTAVASTALTDLDDDTATLRGTINPSGVATTYQFQYGLDTGYTAAPVPSTPGSAGSGFAAGDIASPSVTSLTPDTTYHWRLVATNSYGVTASVDRTFRTKSTPTVTASAPTGTDLGSTNATLRGTVDSNLDATTYQFEYSLNADLSSSTLVPSTPGDNGAGGSSQNVFYAIASGLTPDTDYYVRLNATNSFGTVHSTPIKSFHTNSAPVVTTLAVNPSTDLPSDNSAILHGTVDANKTSTAYRFKYGSAPTLGSQTPDVDAGSGASAINVAATITGLNAGQKYYFELEATNTYGTSITSSGRSFTTTGGGVGGGGVAKGLGGRGIVPLSPGRANEDASYVAGPLAPGGDPLDWVFWEAKRFQRLYLNNYDLTAGYCFGLRPDLYPGFATGADAPGGRKKYSGNLKIVNNFGTWTAGPGGATLSNTGAFLPSGTYGQYSNQDIPPIPGVPVTPGHSLIAPDPDVPSQRIDMQGWKFIKNLQIWNLDISLDDAGFPCHFENICVTNIRPYTTDQVWGVSDVDTGHFELDSGVAILRNIFSDTPGNPPWGESGAFDYISGIRCTRIKGSLRYYYVKHSLGDSWKGGGTGQDVWYANGCVHTHPDLQVYVKGPRATYVSRSGTHPNVTFTVSPRLAAPADTNPGFPAIPAAPAGTTPLVGWKNPPVGAPGVFNAPVGGVSKAFRYDTRSGNQLFNVMMNDGDDHHVPPIPFSAALTPDANSQIINNPQNVHQDSFQGGSTDNEEFQGVVGGESNFFTDPFYPGPAGSSAWQFFAFQHRHTTVYMQPDSKVPGGQGRYFVWDSLLAHGNDISINIAGTQCGVRNSWFVPNYDNFPFQVIHDDFNAAYISGSGSSSWLFQNLPSEGTSKYPVGGFPDFGEAIITSGLKPSGGNQIPDKNTEVGRFTWTSRGPKDVPTTGQATFEGVIVTSPAALAGGNVMPAGGQYVMNNTRLIAENNRWTDTRVRAYLGVPTIAGGLLPQTAEFVGIGGDALTSKLKLGVTVVHNNFRYPGSTPATQLSVSLGLGLVDTLCDYVAIHGCAPGFKNRNVCPFGSNTSRAHTAGELILDVTPVTGVGVTETISAGLLEIGVFGAGSFQKNFTAYNATTGRFTLSSGLPVGGVASGVKVRVYQFDGHDSVSRALYVDASSENSVKEVLDAMPGVTNRCLIAFGSPGWQHPARTPDTNGTEFNPPEPAHIADWADMYLRLCLEYPTLWTHLSVGQETKGFLGRGNSSTGTYYQNMAYHLSQMLITIHTLFRGHANPAINTIKFVFPHYGYGGTVVESDRDYPLGGTKITIDGGGTDTVYATDNDYVNNLIANLNAVSKKPDVWSNDYSSGNPDISETTDQLFDKIGRFRVLSTQVRAKLDAAGWTSVENTYNEDYAAWSDLTKVLSKVGDPNIQGALLACMLVQHAYGGINRTVRWQPEGPSGGSQFSLVTATGVSGGGQSYPAYDAYAYFKPVTDGGYFGEGALLKTVTFNDPHLVEAIASDTHLLLINKRKDPLIISATSVAGFTLQPYEVKLITR